MKFTLHPAVLFVCAVSVAAQTTPSNDNSPKTPTNSGEVSRQPAVDEKDNFPKPAEIQALDEVQGDQPIHAGHGQSPLAGGQIDVLSEMMGVDFGPYLSRVCDDVRLNWYKLMPEVARKPTMKKGKVKIEFSILKNGTIRGMTLAEPSGDVSLDRAAWGGIAASNPFPSLPSQFGGQYIALRFNFLYNPSLTGISPFNVQVPAGSSQQFLPTVKKVTETAQIHVAWSVAGPGCVKQACGTISDDGLYTAPQTVPNPPNVTVKATAKSDLGETASVTVTIVEHPSH